MVGRLFIFLITMVIHLNVFSQIELILNQIDSLKGVSKKSSDVDMNVRTMFNVADNYMDIEYYDSAQVWLNKISDIYLVDKPTIFNYYLFSRRAEVHYYNNLNQLGITNANRSLEIAKKLNDKILLQDAYNILGLLYLSMDSLQTAKDNFIKSIQFISSPPYHDKYLYQSMPHHIYGNLAETYEKMNMLDSSFYYSHKSFEEANTIHNQRGKSIAYNNIAKIYFFRSQLDSALHYYSLSEAEAFKGNEFDVQLINKSGIAEVLMRKKGTIESESSLQQGMELLAKIPNMNTFFRKEFLKAAKSIYLNSKNFNKLQFVTDELLSLEENVNKRHFNQIQYILNNSIKTESKYINANLEQEKKSKQLQINRLYFVILALVIIGILMAFYQYSVREKLKLSMIRNKISQDLHDDVGASLSSINMSASLANKLIDIDIQKAKQTLVKISENAEDGISSLSDMVWAMKPATSQSTTLASRIKNYGYNLLSVKEIQCDYQIDDTIEERMSNIEIRKNLLLLIKEAFNNIAKHSKANQVRLKLLMETKSKILLEITDNGVGFDELHVLHGNGLQNMKRRVHELGGQISFESAPNKGTQIVVRI